MFTELFSDFFTTTFFSSSRPCQLSDYDISVYALHKFFAVLSFLFVTIYICCFTHMAVTGHKWIFISYLGLLVYHESGTSSNICAARSQWFGLNLKPVCESTNLPPEGDLWDSGWRQQVGTWKLTVIMWQ